MREIRQSGSEEGVAQTNAPSLPPILLCVRSLVLMERRGWLFDGSCLDHSLSCPDMVSILAQTLYETAIGMSPGK